MLFNTQCFNNSNQGFIDQRNDRNSSFGFNCQQSNCQYQGQFCPSQRQNCPCKQHCDWPCKQKKEFVLVVEGKVSVIEKPKCPCW